MTQQIQPLGTNPYAEEALQLANIGRGQPGMNSQVPVGPNLIDSGGMSKPNVNTQPYNNNRLMEQNRGQNMSSAVPAQQSNMLGQVRKQTAEMSGAEYKANEMKNERLAQMLYANDGGNATFALGIPEVAALRHQHVAEQKLMANGINPQIPFSSNRFAA
tara:strand:+ start:3138 stop:3617 length:480 start_codon:yes stop_codon:yes gene_type:complete